jgi:putative spermidine/putrescine transport system substrate-binding protein
MADREFEERLERALRESEITRRDLLRRGIVIGAGFTVLPAVAAACGGDDDGGGETPAQIPASGADISMEELIAAAKDEGRINTIALPPDWANYGEIMKAFQTKYGLRLMNASPNASSAEENEAVKALKGQERAPDVLDVGPAFAAEGKADGLYAE